MNLHEKFKHFLGGNDKAVVWFDQISVKYRLDVY